MITITSVDCMQRKMKSVLNYFSIVNSVHLLDGSFFSKVYYRKISIEMIVLFMIEHYQSFKAFISLITINNTLITLIRCQLNSIQKCTILNVRYSWYTPIDFNNPFNTRSRIFPEFDCILHYTLHIFLLFFFVIITEVPFVV